MFFKCFVITTSRVTTSKTRPIPVSGVNDARPLQGHDRLKNIIEDRLRHASGPVHAHPIRYINIQLDATR